MLTVALVCPIIDEEGQFVTPLVVVLIGSFIAAYPKGTKLGDIP